MNMKRQRNKIDPYWHTGVGAPKVKPITVAEVIVVAVYFVVCLYLMHVFL